DLFRILEFFPRYLPIECCSFLILILTIVVYFFNFFLKTYSITMRIVDYFFPKTKIPDDSLVELIEDDLDVKPDIFIYAVLNHNGEMLGVFDTLEKAKVSGQKTTYYGCSIFRYVLNAPCTFTAPLIFEN